MSTTITLAEAKQQQKQLIAELRGGDDGERRVAEILAGCRKGKRCHLHECPVCERRKMRARRRVPAAVVKSIGCVFEIIHIAVDAIQIRGKRRALNEEKVRAIAASMDLIGLQTPLTVKMRKKQVILVTGWHRLSAARRLGWDSIPCVVLIRDETETRIWQIVENLCRAELTVLERAEHIEELRILVRNVIEEGQVAPPAVVSRRNSESRRRPRHSALRKRKFAGPRPLQEYCRRQRPRYESSGWMTISERC